MTKRLLVIKTKDNTPICWDCGVKTQDWPEGGVICTNCETLYEDSIVKDPETGQILISSVSHDFAVDWALGYMAISCDKNSPYPFILGFLHSHRTPVAA